MSDTISNFFDFALELLMWPDSVLRLEMMSECPIPGLEPEKNVKHCLPYLLFSQKKLLFVALVKLQAFRAF